MKKQTVSVSIVLPNWNGARLLEKNLPSVIAASKGAEIIVSDDASTDDSVAMVRQKFPDVRLVTNNRRLGFAGNVNRGVVKASGDVVVLLNTDVRPEHDFLSPLLARFADPAIAAVGCLEKSHEKDGVILRGRGVARWEKGYFIHRRGEVNREDTAWVAGGSSAYRRSVWQKIGGMDELYNPFYWEDIDFSYQMLKDGYRIVFERQSVVHHYHEEGKIKTSYTPQDIKRLAYRNQYLFLWKNISDASIWFAHNLWTPIRLLQAMISGDWLMLQGYILALVKIPAVIKSRKKASTHWKKHDVASLPFHAYPVPGTS